MQRRSLPAILELDQIDPWRFRTVEVTETGMRTFGGSFAGQAIIAAGRTVSPERRIHSAHAHFLRPGDSSRPVTYLVEPIRDGGSYSTRRVEARQGDTVTVIGAGSLWVDGKRIYEAKGLAVRVLPGA